MSNSNFVGRLVVVVSAIIISVLIGLGINYLALPAWTFCSSGFWWFWLVMGLIAVAIYFALNRFFNYIQYEEGGLVPGVVIAGAVLVWLVVFIITAIACGTVTKARTYSKIITVEEGNFQQDIKEIDVDDVITVDVKTAQKLGDRTIANLHNAAWYDVDDEYNLVIINGVKYRISAINYGNVFKYFKADTTGIPGYVVVEATGKEPVAKYVELDEPIFYSPSACFEYDLTRHLRGMYPSYIFGKSFFEVDDNGNPYWITGVKTPQIGLRGALITTSALITDAETGETEEYSLDNLPEWVDHVESVDELMKSLDWYYSLHGGLWNSLTSKTQVYHTTYFYRDNKQTESEDPEKNNDLAANVHTPFEGYNSIVKDDKVMFYTGITPGNEAESNIGFVLIDPRTRTFYFYEAKGADESSPQDAAQGLVNDFRYSASFPTIVNIEGIETYFMVLKDGAGLIQRYAFSNVENYNKCVQAETIEGAINAYKVKMGLISGEISDNNQNGNNQMPDVESVSISGTVLEVKEAQIGGYTYYYFTIEGADAFVFMSSIENSNEQPMKLQIGSKVHIQYYKSQKESGIGIVTSINFE